MNQSTFFNKNRNNIDLIMYHFGMEECEPSHFFGPAVRDHFLIHYVLEGEGTFHVDGKMYRVKENQGFLICPNVVTYYEAAKDNPWKYNWVGFYGVKAESYLRAANLTRISPIFSQNKDSSIELYLREMMQCSKLSTANEVRLQGLLYLFLSKLIETAGEATTKEKNLKELYIKQSIEYIEKNYSRNITISNLAKFIGLNRSYLSALFKTNLNVSPQEFLICYRIRRAEEFLANIELTIGDVARSVGYEDPLTFSKIFRKVNGVSPREYRYKVIG
jgi:AraC-like DNA-binding protein